MLIMKAERTTAAIGGQAIDESTDWRRLGLDHYATAIQTDRWNVPYLHGSMLMTSFTHYLVSRWGLAGDVRTRN